MLPKNVFTKLHVPWANLDILVNYRLLRYPVKPLDKQVIKLLNLKAMTLRSRNNVPVTFTFYLVVWLANVNFIWTSYKITRYSSYIISS